MSARAAAVVAARSSDPCLSPDLSGQPETMESIPSVPRSPTEKYTESCTATKFESVWTLLGGAHAAMNKSKRLADYMTVSAIAFRHNLRLSPTPAHAPPRGIRTYRCEPLVFHGVLPVKRPSRNHWVA
jgi:hypothetical protein